MTLKARRYLATGMKELQSRLRSAFAVSDLSVKDKVQIAFIEQLHSTEDEDEVTNPWQTYPRWHVKKFSWHLACRLTKYKKEFDHPLPSHAPFSHSWHHSYATGPLKFKRNFSTLDVAQGKSSLVILPHSILIQHLKFNGILHRLKLFPRYKYYLPPNSFCSATNADLRIPSLLHITIFQCKKCNQFI